MLCSFLFCRNNKSNQIYNNSNNYSRPAVNVQLEDGNFGNPTYFEFVSGFNKMNWAKIAPQSNVTHVAVIRPKVAGYVNLTQAVISYQPNEKSSRVQVSERTLHST